MNLTEAQYTAVYEHSRNLIVVAGAGSGKTRVLVERYLALLDSHPDWPLNALVAITFTRKAAQEMRDRVRQALESRLNASAGAAERDVWAGRLASMDSARIDTIHGLCGTILRANAAEAGIDPGFGVLDEVESAILLESVIESVLQSVVETGDPALALFGEYDRHSIETVLRGSVNATLPALPDDLMAGWQSVWEQSALEAINRLRENTEFLGAVGWQPVFGWPSGDRLYEEVWQPCFACFDVLLNPQSSVADCVEALQTLGGTISLRAGSAGNWGSRDELDDAKDMLRLIRARAQTTSATIGDPPGPLDARAAQLLPLWARLIAQVQAAFREAKQRQGVLDFDDLEQRTRDLLQSNPQVCARYQQAEFKHLLVDEFQDTNQAQWQIVQSLADPHHPGCLFVVGDQKQSIYSFRGADVSVFGSVRHALTRIGGVEVALARSFRTHQPLVDGFNALFERILTRDESSPAYPHQTDLGQPMDAHRQQPPLDEPALELLLLDASPDNIDPDRRGSDNIRRWEAYEIAQRLHAMVSSEMPVYDRDLEGVRPIRYDDIAILFQSMRQVTLYEEVFKAQELPFVTVAGRGYYNRPEVWDLLNLLKALYNPADNLSLASVLRSPLFGLSDDALLWLRLVEDENGERPLLWDALALPDVVPADEIPLTTFARDCLYDLARLAGRVTISELLHEALNRTGYLATLTGLPDGPRRRGNVEKLLAKAESSGKITLGAFEQYLSDLSAREVREGEALMDVAGSVTLMTVHASKGLEYPVIVLADASWVRGSGDRDVIAFDPQLGMGCKVYSEDSNKMVATFSYRQASRLRRMQDEAERRRLLYVAATRAQDYLLVSGQLKQNKGGWSVQGWLSWLLAALELDDLDSVTDSLVDCGWGTIRARRMTHMPPEDAFIAGGRRRKTTWDQLHDGHSFHAAPAPPPLLDTIEVDRTAAARHLSVTQIADLGAIDVQPGGPYYSERFRRQVFHDAPVRVSSAVVETQPGRLIGEMVHEALRWWQPENSPGDLQRLLRSYAWEHGIVDEREQQEAMRAATHMLEMFHTHPVYQEIVTAQHVYRELPFIYNTGSRIIHGVIDILYQRPDGRWVILDYKTSSLGRNPVQRDADDHARRFHMQVGAYAAAVLEQIRVAETDLDVYIHYIRHNLQSHVKPDDWKTALNSMEQAIGRLVGK